ncbi:MAG TPA: class I SAM-dependent methyltransferase [Chloroflexota bacterium]|nr:class I SAM-dependent methyltransferase [Chloroflexota bacterium]
MSEALPRRYTDLASWFHLLTAPEEYAEEAEVYSRLLLEATSPPPRTLLELGSGGGNNAWHYKRHFTPTLVDLSLQMLAISQRINPECEHVQGDMRSVRLGRRFDAVFVHDAVMYLTTEEALRQAMATAFVHCRPGGVALFVPDCVRETFVPRTEHGGTDGDGRALRYLAWTTDPDPTDNTYLSDFVYVLHEEGQPARCVHEQHQYAVFARADWLRLLGEVGFRASVRPFELSDIPAGSLEAFVAIRPEA